MTFIRPPDQTEMVKVRMRNEMDYKLLKAEKDAKRKQIRELKKQGMSAETPAVRKLLAECKLLTRQMGLCESLIKNNTSIFVGRIIDDNGDHHMTTPVRTRESFLRQFKKLQIGLVNEGKLTESNLYHPENLVRPIDKR